MKTEPITITVDGLTASGKGTAADGLARTFNLGRVDNGMYYRSLAASMR